jgi:hypothetical protein
MDNFSWVKLLVNKRLPGTGDRYDVEITLTEQDLQVNKQTKY